MLWFSSLSNQNFEAYSPRLSCFGKFCQQFIGSFKDLFVSWVCLVTHIRDVVDQKVESICINVGDIDLV